VLQNIGGEDQENNAQTFLEEVHDLALKKEKVNVLEILEPCPEFVDWKKYRIK